MEMVNIADAKMHLSRYVERVRRGARVRISVRGVPVAELVPLEPASAVDDDATTLKLERAGIIRRGEGGLPKELLRPGPRSAGRPASEMIVEERRRRP
jgi:prevent-host-death family protein